MTVIMIQILFVRRRRDILHGKPSAFPCSSCGKVGEAVIFLREQYNFAFPRGSLRNLQVLSLALSAAKKDARCASFSVADYKGFCLNTRFIVLP